MKLIITETQRNNLVSALEHYIEYSHENNAQPREDLDRLLRKIMHLEDTK